MGFPVLALISALLIVASIIIESVRIRKECGRLNVHDSDKAYAIAKICKNNEIPENAVPYKNTLAVSVKDGDNVRVLAIGVPKLFFSGFVRFERDYVDVIYEKNNLSNIRFYDISTIASIFAVRMVKWIALLVIFTNIAGKI